MFKWYFRRTAKGREEDGYVIKNLHSSSAGLGGVNPAKQQNLARSAGDDPCALGLARLLLLVTTIFLHTCIQHDFSDIATQAKAKGDLGASRGSNGSWVNISEYLHWSPSPTRGSSRSSGELLPLRAWQPMPTNDFPALKERDA
jgi:hypothetical protein